MATAAALPALDNTFGAMFIGVVVASALLGVSCVQTWFYYTKYPNDAWYLKLLVAAVFCSDFTHQVLISHSMYIYVITNFGNPAFLIEIVWSLIVEVIMNGITAFLVQSFYVYRIWTLSKSNWILTGAVTLLVLAEVVVVMVYSAHAFKLTNLLEIGEIKTESQLINIFGAAGDVVIAGAMIYLLHGSRTGFKASDGMINRLILFVVNTGLLTSLCAICSLIAILAQPNAYIYICFFFCLGRLYTNSLLATLNARRSTRNAGGDSISFSFDGTSSGTRGVRSLRTGPGSGTATPSGALRSKDITINIERTTEFNRDDEVSLELKASSYGRDA